MGTSVEVQLAARLAELGRDLQDGDLEPFTAWIHAAYGTATADLSRDLTALEVETQSFGAFFSDYDLWLTPTLQIQPPPHGLIDTRRPQTMAASLGMIAFTQIFNASGRPAASVPAGIDRDGLPVGVQLGAGLGREDLLLQVAALLEDAAPWPLHAPWSTK